MSHPTQESQTAAAEGAPAGLRESLLRRLFEDAVKRSNAFGAQLSIIKRGQQLDLAAGFANAERGLLMTTDTLMQIGSITKLFNAMIVVSLAEDRLLELDLPIKTYMPDFEIANPQAARTLTLRHLTSMCSGLDNGPYDSFGSGDDALSLYVHHLGALPQHFSPGQYFGYSNAGCCIAGHVASLVTGRSWEMLLRERVLTPAALNDAAIFDVDVKDDLVSSGHCSAPDGGNLRIIHPNLSAVRAQGPSGSSLALTARDLARFGSIFINKGVGDQGARIIADSSVNLMMSAQIQVPSRRYGSAWCIGPYMDRWSGIQIWGHGGSTTTSSSYLHWIPDQKGVIAFSLNTHSAMGEFSRIVFEEILEVAFGIRRPRVDLRGDPISPVDQRRYVGTYEELGMRMRVVAGEGDTLKAWFFPKPTPQDVGTSRADRPASLRPLGGDRFLVDPPDGPDRHRGVVDMAFFGEDTEGRATNALNLVFPMSRVSK